MKSFAEKYPYIAAWVQGGTVEIGYNDYDDVFLRVTDGEAWFGKAIRPFRISTLLLAR